MSSYVSDLRKHACRRLLNAPPMLLVFSCGTSVLACPAQAQEEDETSVSGRDIVRPTRRFDTRVEHSAEEGESNTTFTFRQDDRVNLGGDWRANLRIDLPFRLVDEVDQSSDLGFSDVLVQSIFVKQVGTEGFGVGTQVIIPTASGKAFGRGQWRLRPTVGYRWSTPAISEGSYFQALVRYDFSIASEEGRGETRELQFSPNLEIEFPDEAYFSVFPSADIRYNFLTNELFIPANFEVGKQWGRVVASLEGGAAIISGDGAPYKWKAELRVGYRF